MEYFHETRRFSEIPRGKYKGWQVVSVPEDFLFWLNTRGRDTALYKWIHSPASGRVTKKSSPPSRRRPDRPSKHTRHFRDHIGHPAQVRASRTGRGVVRCLTCQRDIHVMSEKELLQYLATGQEIVK